MERPIFSSAKLTYKNIDLYIDIDKKDVIIGLYFTIKGESFWKPYLSILCSIAEGQSIHKAKGIGSDDFSVFMKDSKAAKPFFNLAILLLNEVIKVFEGEVSGHQKLTNNLNDELICRCFGTYKGQIVEHCNKNKDASLNSVSEEFLAGAGCSSCQKDIKTIIDQELGVKNSSQTLFINSMSPVELILKLDECLKTFDYMEYQFEIIKLDGYHLSLSSNKDLNNSVKEMLEKHVFTSLKVKLSLIFLQSSLIV